MRATTWDIRMLWIAVLVGSLLAAVAAMFSIARHARRARGVAGQRDVLPGRVGGIPRSLRVRR